MTTTDKPIRTRPNVNDLQRRDPAARNLKSISAQQAEEEPKATRLYEDEELPADLGQPKAPAPDDAPTFHRGPARRPLPRVADPILQWATGLQTKERRIYAGWLVEAGKHAALDEAMEAARFSQVTIKHGAGNLVTHWAVETANVFVIAEGVQSIGEMQHTEERYGIAFGWRTLEGGRQQSQLRARVLLRPLLEAGYAEPLLLTLKSTLTGDLLTALMRQYDVLDAIDAFRALDKKPALQPPFYACSIPLGPGQEVARGSGGQTKEIAPMIAQTPSPVTKEYIRAQWPKRAWVERIESLLDDTITWSITMSKLIGVGEEPREAWEE